MNVSLTPIIDLVSRRRLQVEPLQINRESENSESQNSETKNIT